MTLPTLRRLPAARAAVALGFFLNGVGFASWLVRIPDVQQRLDLSESGLGLVLLGVSAGALAAMPLSGPLIARWGSRAVMRAAALTFAAAVAIAPHAPTAVLLALALSLLGAGSSIMSVALNTQAAAIERRFRRPIMAGLHALYSFGGLIGAGLAGLAAGVGLGAGWHLGMAALAVAAAALLVAPALLSAALDGASGSPAFVRPTWPLVMLGVVSFCVLFGEGAMADWSTVYLRDVAGAGPGLAAAGYAAFSLMMAAGRFVGDALTVRLGAARLVRLGAATAAAGIGLAVAVPQVWAVVLGFAAVGAGLSAVFPTMLAAAGRVPGIAPSAAITVVSSLGVTGLLAGPPLIGFAAEWISLRGGLALVGVTCLAAVGLVRALPLAPARSLRAGKHPGEARRPRIRKPHMQRA